MSDPFVRLPGAVALSGSEAVAHLGSPLREQRALAEGNSVVCLSHHGVVTVSGPDRLTWLHAMTSQSVQSLSPGESTESLLLDGNGRIEHAMRVVDDGERTWLLVDAGRAESLTDYLTKMRFTLRVEVENVSDRFAAVLAFAGGSAIPALRGLNVAVVEWHDPWGSVSPGGVQYAKGEHAGAAWSAVQFVCARGDLRAGH